MSIQEIQLLKSKLKKSEAINQQLQTKVKELREIKKHLEPKAAKINVAVECVSSLEQMKNIIDSIKVGDLTLGPLDSFNSLKSIVDALYDKHGGSVSHDDMTINIGDFDLEDK